MALDITHFAVGTGATALVVTLLVPRVSYPRTWVVLGGIWALIPRFAVELSVASGRLAPLFDSRAADLFWFYHTISRLSFGPDIGMREQDVVGAIALVFMAGAIALAEYLSYQRPALESAVERMA